MFGFDRRYVLIPMALIVALLVGAYFVADRAQTRLSQRSQQIRDSEQRRTLISNFMVMTLDAETGQRGYLISGKESFLLPYRQAVAQRGPAMQALRDAYRDYPRFMPLLEDLDLMVTEIFDQMERSLGLEKKTAGAALAYIRGGTGKRTMDRIREATSELQSLESATLADLLRNERRDLQVTNLITAGGTALNIALVLLAGLLISRAIRRRSNDALGLLAEKQSLEGLVGERTAELTALSSHLQQVTEQEKAALARELHDELGGLLVAAKMDLVWLRRHTSSENADVRTRWDRILGIMDSGVDFKRRVVEQLRPTLLDNMGLHAALHWQLQESCARAGIRCFESLPEQELPLSSEASIAIFRVAQEAMTNIIKHARATEVKLSVEVWAEQLRLAIEDNGVGLTTNGLSQPASHGVMSMRHRVSALGGHWSIGPGLGGKGTLIQVRLPMRRILATSGSQAVSA
jgi:signal transduction histidine kinase